MKKKMIGIFVCMLLIATALPTTSIMAVETEKETPVDVTFIIGLFPRVTGENITYLSLIPFGMETIAKDGFDGHIGIILIFGTYEPQAPIASYTYEPSEDKLRVIENPIFLNSTSIDPDGVIVEQWWQFEEDGEWVEGDNHVYIYNESGYHQVTLRVTDNDGLTDGYTKRIRVYNRLPWFQVIPEYEESTLTITGVGFVGGNQNYDWEDFANIGEGSCTLPSTGHPDIGDVFTDCLGEIIIQYVHNGVISCQWQF